MLTNITPAKSRCPAPVVPGKRVLCPPRRRRPPSRHAINAFSPVFPVMVPIHAVSSLYRLHIHFCSLLHCLYSQTNHPLLAKCVLRKCRCTISLDSNILAYDHGNNGYPSSDELRDLWKSYMHTAPSDPGPDVRFMNKTSVPKEDLRLFRAAVMATRRKAPIIDLRRPRRPRGDALVCIISFLRFLSCI